MMIFRQRYFRLVGISYDNNLPIKSTRSITKHKRQYNTDIRTAGYRIYIIPRRVELSELSRAASKYAIASRKSTFRKWSRKILRLSSASVHRQRFEPNPIRGNGAGHGCQFHTSARHRCLRIASVHSLSTARHILHNYQFYVLAITFMYLYVHVYIQIERV